MKRETRRTIKELAYYASIGLSVAFSIFIGLFIGVYLDRRFNTTPWFTLIFLGLGIAAGYRNIGLAIKKSRKLWQDILSVEIQQRLIIFITRTNWILFFITSIIGLVLLPPDFARGIIFGGLIVTINFHLLYRTLKKAFRPSSLASHNVVLAKYYVRFLISGIIIFLLISGHYVDPLGLFIGLSVVVVSIILATMCELTKLIFKEAT